MATLEDFIKQHLQNKKIEDYESWLVKYGQSAEGAYKNAVRAADTAAAEAKATYGTRGAALLARGLTGSGYSDYLSGLAYTEKQRAVRDAKSAYTKANAANQTAYAAYLDKERDEAVKAAEKEAERRKSLFLSLLSQNVEDEESAAAFLTENGLDAETAARMAKKSVSMVKNASSVKKAVLSYALNHYMPYKATYDYAISYGLSPAVAEEIAKTAHSALNANYNPEDYF